MYETTQNYLYIKKRRLCKDNNKNTIAYPTRILNLQGVPTLQLNNPITCPTNITPVLPAPFYEVYTIDPSGALVRSNIVSAPCRYMEKYVVYQIS